MKKNKPFKVCITMAGAVSAGAYTAGVMDYLLETLELWQQAKDRNTVIKNEHPNDYLAHGYDESIPMHDVVIEVIGGASAGGITGTLTLLSLIENPAAFTDRSDLKNNKLYQSWVEMADDDKKTTFSKLLSTEDINGKVESLLNTEPLDEIADKALQLKKIGDYPAYISPSLDLILTVSNLRGLKYKIDFQGKDENAGTYITTHSGFFRYRVENETMKRGVPKGENELYYVLCLDEDDPQGKKDRVSLKQATLSTSAFPFGLRPIENRIGTAYLDRYTSYLFSKNEGLKLERPKEDMYKFIAVDGGMINNEPFGYTLKVLKEKHEKIEEDKNYAMIMIDPFPNYQEIEEEEQATDIVSVAGLVYKALRNQVLFKQDDILSALNDENDTRFLIAPVRKVNKKRVPNSLACGALGGFSGFIDKKFRAHDYQLGRQNCQSFLRYYFAVKKEDMAQKFDTPIGAAAYERFYFQRPQSPKDGEKIDYFFPIIPDMKVAVSHKNKYKTNIFSEKEAEIKFSDIAFPSIELEAFTKTYYDEMRNRIHTIRKHYVTKRLYRLAAWLFKVDTKIYYELINRIHKGLKKQGLLK